jgi:hypothetical protein
MLLDRKLQMPHLLKKPNKTPPLEASGRKIKYCICGPLLEISPAELVVHLIGEIVSRTQPNDTDME